MDRNHALTALLLLAGLLVTVLLLSTSLAPGPPPRAPLTPEALAARDAAYLTWAGWSHVSAWVIFPILLWVTVLLYAGITLFTPYRLPTVLPIVALLLLCGLAHLVDRHVQAEAQVIQQRQTHKSLHNGDREMPGADQGMGE